MTGSCWLGAGVCPSTFETVSSAKCCSLSYASIHVTRRNHASGCVDPSAVSPCFDHGKHQMRLWKMLGTHKEKRGFLTRLKASFLRWAQVFFEALEQMALFVALLKTWLEVTGFPSEAQCFMIFIFLLFYWHNLEISLLFVFMCQFLEHCGEDKIEKLYWKSELSSLIWCISHFLKLWQEIFARQLFGLYLSQL